MGFIYKITNTINGKAYIGQTTRTITYRFEQHKRCKKKYYLYCAFKKYGIENFKLELIEKCDNSKLNEREIYWVSFYDTYYNGYNLTKGGKSGGKSNMKPVLQYDLEGNFIKKYESLVEAVIQNNFNNAVNIKSCCQGTTKTAYNYQWRYENSKLPVVKFHSKEEMMIIQYDLFGKKIAEYSNFKEASEKTNINAKSIGEVINGKKKTTHNFIFTRKYQKLNLNEHKLNYCHIVSKYTLNGKLVKTYISKNEAMRDNNISRNCKMTFLRKIKLGLPYKDFIWKVGESL